MLGIQKTQKSEIVNLTVQDLYSLDKFSVCCSVIGIGNFDGVHLGHQEIIKNCIYSAKLLNCQSVIISFFPHPTLLIKPTAYLGLITSYEDKIQKITNLGIEKVVNLTFDQDMANMTDHEFIDLIVKKFCPKKIITGDNFFYGSRKHGNVMKLSYAAHKLEFSYSVVQQIFYQNEPISSSLVRQALQKGFIEKTNLLLGANYTLTGKVQVGKKVASSKLGYPTANFMWPNDLFQIKFGVYFSRVFIDDKFYFGVTNIGIKPTVSQNQEVIVESHIVDFCGDLYERVIKLELLSFLRPERQFSDLWMLKTQINKDVKLAKHLIKFGSFKN